jgi:hypothetical protein
MLQKQLIRPAEFCEELRSSYEESTTLKVIACIDTLAHMNRENETGVKTGKITPYKIFGWVPLSLFFISAGTMAFFGFLKGL